MATPDELMVAALDIMAIAHSESMYRATINRLYYATFHVTVQPLRGELDRIAVERPEQDLKHAMALFAKRVEA